MSQLQPPPTWALPVIVDETTGKPQFSPIWLKWFVDLAQVLSSAGVQSGGSIVHNGLSGLQGGTPGQYYHLTYAEYSIIAYAGTVASVSVVTANGLAGTVTTPTTTPAITLSTTVTGLVKGNGTAFSPAVSGTDYAPATSGSAILYGNSGGGFSNVAIGSGVAFSGGTLSATGSGGSVTSVAMTAPSFLSVGGSPITTSGTLALSYSGTAIPVTSGGTGVLTSTGTGSTVLSTSPTLVTPTLGAATATSVAMTTGQVSTSPSGSTDITNKAYVDNAISGAYTAGTGLTLTGTQFSITNTAVSAASYGGSATVGTFTVNAQGQLTSAANATISIPASAINTVIPNSGLANSSTTFNGVAVALGASGVITAVNPNALTIGTGLSGTSYDGSAAINIAALSTYLNTSFAAQTSILVTHNFGKYPVVNILDNTGAVVLPLTITHGSVNAFTTTFSAATTGNIIAATGF